MFWFIEQIIQYLVNLSGYNSQTVIFRNDILKQSLIPGLLIGW